jgi:hypothetical protein
MSSPKAATAKAAATKSAAAKAAQRPRALARPVTKPVAKIATKTANGVSAEATRLAGELERALVDGKLDALSVDALQALTLAVCRTYGARVEAGEQISPLPAGGPATATDVMITASGLLKAANLAVFELGMWQSWTGR